MARSGQDPAAVFTPASVPVEQLALTRLGIAVIGEGEHLRAGELTDAVAPAALVVDARLHAASCGGESVNSRNSLVSPRNMKVGT